MTIRISPKEAIERIVEQQRILIVQDLDGVCIPLVKDPMKRVISDKYVRSAGKLSGELAVLTCGEHEGKRGVNRLIEQSIGHPKEVKEKGMYLPGLAACGVEYQDKKGNVSHEGITKKELEFLSNAPDIMRSLLQKEIALLFPKLDQKEIDQNLNFSVCDTRFSPTINLNSLFNLTKKDVRLKVKLQESLDKIMNRILEIAEKEKLFDSFFLHKSPNLGKQNGTELIKYASDDNIGTTDIQLLLSGAIKEKGLILLLNKYVKSENGYYPFGKSFNVRKAPDSHQDLIELCKSKIPTEVMPTLIGVGDTVTSVQNKNDQSYMRGGSDRGFLYLIQELGEAYKKENLIIYVDSSSGEVDRPSYSDRYENGITDSNDLLKFNLVISKGTDQYIEWFEELAERLSRKNK